FFFKDGPAAGVFVAQVDIDLAHARAPGGDQHAFEEAMRVALEVPAVLEGARLALVDVHRHQARLGLGGDDLPLAAGRKAGAAQAAQTRVLHDLGDLFARVFTGEAVGNQLIAAAFPVCGEVDVLRF